MDIASLLNNSSEPALLATKGRLPPLQVQYSLSHSREPSSCASTPSLSPQTPQLSRSNSSDSRNLASPSPLTPSSHNIDSQHHSLPRQAQQQHYFIHRPAACAKMDDQTAALYPPIPDATGLMSSAYVLPPQMQPQSIPLPLPQPIYDTSNSPQSEPSHLSAVSSASNVKAQPKKNQYPCPMAKQVGCADFFTTSGHAARHAKKHTGKKDAFCPECNKAFTRKDNMEQHRRTHQNGRGTSRSSNNGDEAKVKKTKTPSKKSTVKVEPLLEAALEQQLAEQQPQTLPVVPSLPQSISIPQALQQQALAEALMVPPIIGQPYFLNTIDPGPIPALPNVMPDLNMRPPLHRSNFTNSLEYVPPMVALADPGDALHYAYPSPGLSNGLNSLALAASEHRRLSEEKQSQSPQASPFQETPTEQT